MKFIHYFVFLILCTLSLPVLVSLRIQINPENKAQFAHISQERAFADFLFCHLILHLVVINFIG